MDAPASPLAFAPFDRVTLLGVTMDRMELGDLRGAEVLAGSAHLAVVGQRTSTTPHRERGAA